MAMNLDAVFKIKAQVEGQSALEKLGLSIKAVGDNASKTLSPFGSMKGAMQGLANAAATVGLAAIGKTLLDSGLAAQQAAIRIKSLAGPLGEVDAVMALSAKAAKQFALGNTDAQSSVANLYGRLRPMGISLKDIETVFMGTNKAARLMGLSTGETSNVMLQFSQALGSGKLQGDELRSIMEQLPAVGQAVAKVMGVNVSELKKLGSEGKITTDIMIQAAAALANMAAPPPTSMQEFTKAMADLQTEIGENLLPILTPFMVKLTEMVKAFGAMPEPIQTAIVLFGALAIAIGPISFLISGIGSAIALLGIAWAGMGPIIAGWAGAVVPAIAGIQAAFLGILGWFTSTLLPGLLAFFSGPAGWTVLAVAAVVAMVVLFRKPLEDFVAWLWDWGEPIRRFWGDLWNSAGDTAREAFTALPGVFDQYITRPFLQIGPTLQTNWKALWDSLTGIAAAGWKAFSDGNQKNLVEPFLASRDKIAKGWEELAPKITLALAGIGDLFRAKVTTPIQEAWQSAVAFMQGVITKAQAAFAAAWNAIAGGIQGAFRGMLGTIANVINSIIGALNSMIDGINSVRAAVKLGPIGKLGYVSAPAFAEGGVVTRPTLAMVGEGGEREYIIPESKMARAVSNYLAGERGAAVLTSRTYQPAAAAGPARGGSGAPQRSSINITTGPVQQIDGKRYATLADLESVAQQVATQIYGTLRTPAGRRSIGVA